MSVSLQVENACRTQSLVSLQVEKEPETGDQGGSDHDKEPETKGVVCHPSVMPRS